MSVYQIKMTNGVALVDECEMEVTHTVSFSCNLYWEGKLGDVNWRASGKSHTDYAISIIKGSIELRMHRLVMDAEPKMIIDHIDGNGLNNCRSNLRFVTAKENAANRRKIAPTSSSYKGVEVVRGKIYAYIRVDGKKQHLGTFATQEEAARAYDAAALLQWGDKASLNFNITHGRTLAAIM